VKPSAAPRKAPDIIVSLGRIKFIKKEIAAANITRTRKSAFWSIFSIAGSPSL